MAKPFSPGIERNSDDQALMRDTAYESDASFISGNEFNLDAEQENKDINLTNQERHSGHDAVNGFNLTAPKIHLKERSHAADGGIAVNRSRDMSRRHKNNDRGMFRS